MLEAKLELAINELISNIIPRKKFLLLQTVSELLLNISYFKTLMENYPNLGPLMYPSLINNLKFKKYNEKAIIWDYNDPVDGIYIIVKGEVKIYKQPLKSKLIKCQNKIKNKFFSDNKNKLKDLGILSNIKEINKASLKYSEHKLNVYKKRAEIYGTDLFKQPKVMQLNKRNNDNKVPKFPSAKYLNNFNITIDEHKNISIKEQQISLTEQNYIYKEPQESRILDYTENFGKMIGEDALLQELTNRKYACETSCKCILAFLSAKNYHIFYDKINNTNKGNIISFLYKLNYFNDKNDFIHKLYKAIRTKTYKKGSFIYKKNMPFLYMYIIKSGTVSIFSMKTCKYKSDIEPDLITNNKKILIKNKSLNDIFKINNKAKFNHFTKERTFELNGEYEEKKIYTLINYGKGELLGNIEYYMKLKKYLFSVKCITNVEVLEIDMEIFNKIYKPYNIGFFKDKTQQQIKYFFRRIKEINIMHHKYDEDEYRSRNKLMKLFYKLHPLSSLKINPKYINNGKNLFPINIKYKNKKLKNTKVSPLCLYELASVVNYKRKASLHNLFITNNMNLSNIFKGNNNTKNSFLNSEYQMDNKKEIINLNSIKKLNLEKEKNKQNQKQGLSYRKSEEKDKKFEYEIKNKYNSFYLGSAQFNKRKKIGSLEHKIKNNICMENNSKNRLKLRYTSLNFKNIQNKEKSSDINNNFIYVYQQVKKDKLKKQEDNLRDKRKKFERKKEINSMIAFNGYQVYLNKGKRTTINLKKHI